jgi:aspartyl-tRNA(Asn)/glutamyl-tRNA(Gln) amidotransferase subunit B
MAIGPELANWITVDLRGVFNKIKVDVSVAGTTWVSSVPAQELATLVVMKHKGEVSGPIAKSVLEEMFTTGKGAAEIIKAKGLTQVSDEGALEKIIDEVMAKNPQQLAQYKSGKEAVFGFFVGQVMKASGGKANPAKANELLKRKLAQ